MNELIDLPGVGQIELKGAFHTKEQTAVITQYGDMIMPPPYAAMLEKSLGQPPDRGDIVMSFTDDNGGYVTGVVDKKVYAKIMKALRDDLGNHTPRS